MSNTAAPEASNLPVHVPLPVKPFTLPVPPAKVHVQVALTARSFPPVKIAQEQLGHASVATTLNIYTHVVDASHRLAIEAVDGSCSQLFPSRRKRTPRP